MSRFVILVTLAASLAGCGLIPPGRVGGIAVSVPPEEYARRLCGHLPLEDYPSCANQVLDYFDYPQDEERDPGASTSGPIAAILGSEVYVGDYHSTPLSASLRLTKGKNTCLGSYSAFGESVDARFDLYCSDGRSGWADLILDLGGRDGIGRIMLDDGTEGQIVFGHTALGQAKPYPYKP